MRTLFLIALFIVPGTVSAAGVALVPPVATVRAGDTIAVPFVFDTDADTVNALEGSLHLSSGLSVVEIRLQGSVVPLWLMPPEERTSGVVSFAGVLPGGYRGSGTAFTIIVRATRKGTDTITYGSETALYKNDGKGTALPLTRPMLTLSVQAASGTSTTVSAEADSTPPEPFIPSVTSGAPFGQAGTVLVFLAQDKESGIARYDIARSYYPHAAEADMMWQQVESPYLFEEGDATRYLYVRATDHAGNTRIAEVAPTAVSVVGIALRYWPLVALLALGLLAILVRRFFGTAVKHRRV